MSHSRRNFEVTIITRGSLISTLTPPTTPTTSTTATSTSTTSTSTSISTTSTNKKTSLAEIYYQEVLDLLIIDLGPSNALPCELNEILEKNCFKFKHFNNMVFYFSTSERDEIYELLYNLLRREINDAWMVVLKNRVKNRKSPFCVPSSSAVRPTVRCPKRNAVEMS
ncbi:hypothetical protein RCL_jg23296.t1 [Rhizophagus clarus]|uniref:Uncharacterized protein n=1 Tax=Rhizophagus clarus TaxID=94130 RepID=A0A8H3L3J6_9GLOM|nr:hypothetical protein RCL_jg23296.t1 [Rhizophagus clarus]